MVCVIHSKLLCLMYRGDTGKCQERNSGQVNTTEAVAYTHTPTRTSSIGRLYIAAYKDGSGITYGWFQRSSPVALLHWSRSPSRLECGVQWCSCNKFVDSLSYRATRHSTVSDTHFLTAKERIELNCSKSTSSGLSQKSNICEAQSTVYTVTLINLMQCLVSSWPSPGMMFVTN